MKNASPERYREAMNGRPDIPLWQRPWWLDATAADRWGAVTLFSGKEPIAALPYLETRVRGLRTWGQPLLTQSLGPWLRPSTEKYVKHLSREHRLLANLLGELPQNVAYRQNWTPDRTNWLPFSWAGFRQTTRYTYRLDLTKGEDAIWSEMSEASRRRIRKAVNRFGVTVDETDDLADFLALNAAVFERQGKQVPYSQSLVRRVHRAAEDQKACRLLIAREADGTASAAAFLVRDDTTTYYLMGGSDPERRRSAAHTLVLWRAIQAEIGTSAVFDFEGSMIEGVETAFRSFGARQVPYLSVSGSHSKWLRRRMAAEDLLRQW